MPTSLPRRRRRPASTAGPAPWLVVGAILAGLWSPAAAAQPGAATGLDEIESMIAGGRHAAAEQALLSLGDAGPRADYLLGFARLELYRFAEAETALRRAVAGEPENHAWLLALAKSLLEQGRNLAAMEVLERAIALEPDPDYFFARAMCALNLGDLDSAEADLRRSIRARPGHTEALYKLGRILVDRGDYGASLEHLRACLDLRPNHLEARFLLGLAANHTGDPETAREAFEAVIAAVPGHVGARYNLGRALLQLGREEEGMARLDEFREMSRLRDQIDFFRQAVKKNPRNAEGRAALARLLLQAGRTEEALREALAARQLAPADPKAYRLLAAAFRRLGREADARRADEFAQRLAAGP